MRRADTTARRAIPRFSPRKHWVGIVIFVVGFAVLMYPFVSQWYYSNDIRQTVTDFDTAREALDEAEIARRMELARAYNDTLDPGRLTDPYSPREQEGRAEYARMLEVNELLGHVEVPRIGQDIPVYAGTNDTVLNKGAGHLEGTSLPVGGIDTHSVVTAHRGLPTARLFTDLDKMEIGDTFYMHNAGGVLAYQVDQILTVEPHDFDPVLVQPGQDYMTLLTCTPYMINSHRLLVRGIRIPMPEGPLPDAGAVVPWDVVLPAALAALLMGALGVRIVAVAKKRRAEKAPRRGA
ncbi:MAG TPA: class C sortase [Propionibacterium sp.]|nr:class C sortase [Propionibacterium sp.]